MSKTMKRVLLTLLCLMLLGGAVFFALWELKLSPNAPYNSANPRTLMEELVVSTSKEQWKQQLYALWDDPITEYEDAEEVFSALFESLTEEEFSFRSSGEKNSFVLSSGENDLAALSFSYENEQWSQSGIRSLLHAQSGEIRILVPEGVVPTVNGVSVAESALTNRALPYEDMNEWEREFENCQCRWEYTVSGLYLLPEVEAEGTRLILREENSWSFEPVDARSYSLRISAPSDATVVVEGVTLDESLVTRTETVPVDVEISEELQSSLPAYSRYELSGLYSAEPRITVTAADGSELVGLEGENGLISYANRSQSAPEEEIDTLAKNYIRALCNYGAGIVYSDTMYMYTVPGSDLQTFLNRAQGSLTWIQGTGLTLQEPIAEDFIPLGEDACVCTARVTGSVKNYYMTYEAEFVCQLLCTRTDNGWKVADMAYE